MLHWLLQCYPGAFRRRYGQQILAFWIAQRREARYGTPILGTLRYWLELLGDAVRTGARLRRGHDATDLLARAPNPRHGDATRAPEWTPPPVLRRLHWVAQDLRYAGRSLKRQPLFTFVAIATLAIGIGSTTAVFSIVDNVLFRPLPYADPAALVSLGRVAPTGRVSSLALPEVQALARLKTFRAFAPALGYGANVQWDDSAEVLNGATVGHRFFEVLGVRPLLGRTFTAQEDVAGGADVVLISARVWQRQFTGAVDVLGARMVLDRKPYVIIGVVPDGIDFPEAGRDFWTPFRDAKLIRDFDLNPDSRDITFFSAVARLASGETLARARGEIDGLFRSLNVADERESDAVLGSAMSLHEATVGGSRTGLLLFFGSVGLVFAIACANVAGLWLTRIAGRSTEIAVRTALGAGRLRIVAWLFAESLALAAAGGAAGVGLAMALQRALLAIVPTTIPRLDSVHVDARILLFAIGLTVLSALVFGTLPALRAAGGAAAGILREGGRGASASTRASARRALVVAQIAIAVVLLAGAGLFANSYARLVRVELGLRSQGIMLAHLSPSLGDGGTEGIRSFYDRLLPAVGALPGVTGVGMTYSPPLGQSNFRQTVVTETMAEDEEGVWAGTVIISPGYLDVAGIPLLRGRSFTAADILGAPNVVIVNEAMAEALWPGEDPIGKRFKWGKGLSGSLDSFEEEFFPLDWVTVVGVAGNVRRRSLAQDPVPEYYRPHPQMSWPSMTLVMATNGDHPTLAADVRRTVAAIDSTVPVSNVRSLQRNIDSSVAEPRFRVLLVGAFALVACLLAMLGVYAVMALTVSRRTQDIGLRMALGARPAAVSRQVVAEGMRLAVVGAVLGLALAFAAGRVIGAMLFDITPTDPATLATVTVATLAVAAVACYVPARRASRLDPLAALRGEGA